MRLLPATLSYTSHNTAAVQPEPHTLAYAGCPPPLQRRSKLTELQTAEMIKTAAQVGGAANRSPASQVACANLLTCRPGVQLFVGRPPTLHAGLLLPPGALPSAAYRPQRPDDKARWIDSVVTQKVGGLGRGPLVCLP